MDESERRLAVYGSLAPGRPNHHVVQHLPGRWIEGAVRGVLRNEGWGSGLGFPGIVLDDRAPRVGVQLLESPELPSFWSVLDDFEGAGYRRTVTPVATAEGELRAQIYALVTRSEAGTTS